MLRSSFSVGGRASSGATGDDVLDKRLQADALLLQVLHLGGVPDDHHRAVVDIRVVRGAGDDESVDEGHRHADLHRRRAGAPEEPAGGRTVQVDDVTDPSVGQRNHDRESLVGLEADVADNAFVQNAVDGRTVIGRPVGVAVHRRAFGDHFAHGEHFLSPRGCTRLEGVLGRRRNYDPSTPTVKKHGSLPVNQSRTRADARRTRPESC